MSDDKPKKKKYKLPKNYKIKATFKYDQNKAILSQFFVKTSDTDLARYLQAYTESLKQQIDKDPADDIMLGLVCGCIGLLEMTNDRVQAMEIEDLK